MTEQNISNNQNSITLSIEHFNNVEFLYDITDKIYDNYIQKAYKNNKFSMDDVVHISNAKKKFDNHKQNKIIIQEEEPYSIYSQACRVANKNGAFSLKEAHTLCILVKIIELKIKLLKEEKEKEETENKVNTNNVNKVETDNLTKLD